MVVVWCFLLSAALLFFLANLDMDLCCLIDSEEKLNASDLVTMVGDLLERGTFTSVLVCLCISANLNSLFSLP